MLLAQTFSMRLILQGIPDIFDLVHPISRGAEWLAKRLSHFDRSLHGHCTCCGLCSAMPDAWPRSDHHRPKAHPRYPKTINEACNCTSLRKSFRLTTVQGVQKSWHQAPLESLFGWQSSLFCIRGNHWHEEQLDFLYDKEREGGELLPVARFSSCSSFDASVPNDLSFTERSFHQLLAYEMHLGSYKSWCTV